MNMHDLFVKHSMRSVYNDLSDLNTLFSCTEWHTAVPIQLLYRWATKCQSCHMVECWWN